MDGRQGGRGDRPWDEKTRALVACLEALLELHRERVGAAAALAVRPEPANDSSAAAAEFGGLEFMPGRAAPIAGALPQE